MMRRAGLTSEEIARHQPSSFLEWQRRLRQPIVEGHSMLRAGASARRQTEIVFSSTFLEGYKDWFERFKRISSAYKQGLIQEVDLQKYQLFLFGYGQFNANFTLEELNKLHYPLSPFSIMHRHTYLRGTESWAVEILTKWYLKDADEKLPEKRPRLYPIFIDSKYFWDELDRYCTVVDAAAVDFSANITKFLSKQVWVRLNEPEDKQAAEQKIRDIITLHIINQRAVLEDNKLGTNTLKVALKKSKKQYSPEEKKLLDLFLEKELVVLTEKIERENREKSEKRDKSWYGPVFGLFKQNNTSFLEENNIKTPIDLFKYAEQNKVTFEQYYKKLPISEEKRNTKTDKIYRQAIDQWIKAQVDPLLKQYYYFVQQCCMGMETLVLVGHKEAESSDSWGPKSLVNYLGYRVDPVRVMRRVLSCVPKLFVEAEQTADFWDLFLTTTMVAKLPESERINIGALKNKLIQQIQKSTLTRRDLCFFKTEWQLLNTMEFHPPFALYVEYIKNYLANYQKYNSENRTFTVVVNPEIKLSLSIFLQACYDKNLPIAIRCVQVIAEVMLLDLENQPLRRLLPEIIREDHLRIFPVQAVLMTPYAMRAFVRVFQTLDSEYTDRVPNVFVTNQSYFEWLSNIGRLDSKRYSVIPVRHTSEIEHEADIIFVEIHPNNVVETRQFAHDLEKLIDKMYGKSWQTKGRTLVVDATLNALDDEEIQNTLRKARRLVDSGWLNIILIQSLTKFSQLGIDQRSAGILIAINSGESYWATVNYKLSEFSKIEPVDSSTINFFSYFFTLNKLTKKYISQVNRNVRFVYAHIIEQFNDLEILNRSRFQITMSSDPKTCYVALNMRGLLPDVDSGFSLKTRDIERFSEELLRYFIHPLCEFFGLSLTERMSIGFPLCSINLVYDSIRFTVGLEPDEQLLKYADILAYVAFALNRQRDARLFFELGRDDQYQLRRDYFTEKVEQFKAMTPGGNYSFCFQFEGMSSGNSYQPSLAIPERQLKRIVNLHNGEINLFREIPNPHSAEKKIFCQYDANTILMPIRKFDRNIPLSDPVVGIQTKRMAIACLTEYTSSDHKNHQNVKLLFRNRSPFEIEPSTLTLSSMEILSPWNSELVYGPFDINGQPAFFHLYQKRILLLFDNKVFSEADICIKQGNTITPLLDMPIEDREFIFREGSYEIDRSARDFRRLYPTRDLPEFEYRPRKFQPNFSIENDKIVVEHDFPCCKIKGISVYKRYIDENLTCVEIDYWKEKDPILSRFLTLMIAIFVKDSKGLSFVARNNKFCHLLFNIAFDKADEVFEEAIRCVSDKEAELTLTFQSYERTSSLQQYSFFNDSPARSWPSGYSGVDYIENDGSLIESSLGVCKLN